MWFIWTRARKITFSLKFSFSVWENYAITNMTHFVYAKIFRARIRFANERKTTNEQIATLTSLRKRNFIIITSVYEKARCQTEKDIRHLKPRCRARFVMIVLGRIFGCAYQWTLCNFVTWYFAWMCNDHMLWFFFALSSFSAQNITTSTATADAFITWFIPKKKMNNLLINNF